MKISGHEWKTGKRGRVGDVQHSHILVRMNIMFSQTLQENVVLAKKIELDATKNWSKRRVTHNYC